MDDLERNDLEIKQSQMLKKKWKRVRFRYREAWVGAIAVFSFFVLGCAAVDYVYHHYFSDEWNPLNGPEPFVSRYAFVVGAFIGGLVGQSINLHLNNRSFNQRWRDVWAEMKAQQENQTAKNVR